MHRPYALDLRIEIPRGDPLAGTEGLGWTPSATAEPGSDRIGGTALSSTQRQNETDLKIIAKSRRADCALSNVVLTIRRQSEIDK